LDKEIKNIAVIGPLGDNQYHMNGFWRGKGEAEDVVTLLEGIKAKVSANTNVQFAEGSGLETVDNKKLSQAIELAKRSDVVILAVGEDADNTGESSSRTNIDLYPAQKALVKAIHQTGTPVVMVIMNGRPLAIEWSSENIPSILNAWFLGSEAGNALADVLFGDYNPSAKLTMTVPRSTGQIPIFYNVKRVSRPMGQARYTSKYIDSPNKPLYPFGYGLSYTDFSYSRITLSTRKINFSESLTASVTVTNTGKRFGEEVVQLYIQDMVGSVVRPVKELKGFEKIALEPGQSQKVTFTISADDLAFYTRDMSFKAEAGGFRVSIGASSDNVKSTVFRLMSE
jgi:beta-glucosidase